MKLHGYLDQLLGSKSSISVLRTLVQYKGKVFTIRRLAREANVSHPSVSETVAKLESLGVVQIQPIGRSHQVILNEKSYVLKNIVEPMFMAEKQTFNQMICFLKNHLSTKKSLEPQFLEVLQKVKKKKAVILMLSSYPMEVMHRPFCSSKFSVNFYSKLGLCIAFNIFSRTIKACHLCV